MSVTTFQPTLSDLAKQRLIDTEDGAFLINDWVRAVFMHYRVPPGVLQAQIPFELDLFDGDAYVSLVAFEFLNLRIRMGKRILRWMKSPLNNHGFLNVRTYVKHNGEQGVFFLAEWLPDGLAVLIGPRTFGLPYRFGKLDYTHDYRSDGIHGQVEQPGVTGRVAWQANLSSIETFVPCEPESLDAFLMERYTAFTHRRSTQRLFHIWHEQWPQTPIDLTLTDTSLLAQTGPWIKEAEFIGANYSPGVEDVWIGRPQCINGAFC